MRERALLEQRLHLTDRERTWSTVCLQHQRGYCCCIWRGATRTEKIRECIGIGQ